MRTRSAYGEARTAERALTMATEFDMREVLEVQKNDTSLTSGSMNNGASGSDGLRSRYYCRSIYNPTTGSLTVRYKIQDHGSTHFQAEIPSGLYFHAYQNITAIMGTSNGTDAGRYELCYVERPIVVNENKAVR